MSKSGNVSSASDLKSFSFNLTAKELLRKELIDQNISRAELAQRLHISHQKMTSVLNLSHETDADFLATAFKALGKRLELYLA